MLGPDAELLGDILKDLGKKHAHFGVKADFFPFMGDALIATLKETLGEQFTPETEKSWLKVYAALSDKMVEAMSTHQAVLDSWSMLKTVRNYDSKAGVLLFQAFFRKCPRAKPLFGFPLDMDVESENMINSRRFIMHSRYFIEMLDRALSMVEANSMEEHMKELGALHASYGVKPEFFPLMGEALFYSLEVTLPKGVWSKQLHTAWGELFAQLSSQIIASMKIASKENSSAIKSEQALVLESWTALKTVENYDQKAGVLLFQQLFRQCPEAKALFGFPIDMDVESETMLRSRRFTMHAKYFVGMLDRALSMVEAKNLEENLKQLGTVHAAYGVKPEFFPVMGQALFYTLEQTLPAGSWTPELRAAWEEVFNSLSAKMIAAMKTEQAIVLDSWSKLKTIRNYDEKAGVLLFQHLFRRCPEAKQLFGFPIDLDVDSETMINSRRFTMHAKYFIEMLDRALSMVEAKCVEENMKQLGALHATYGVKPEFFPIMGDALFYTLEETLPAGTWNDTLRFAWKNLFEKLSAQMILAMKESKT